MTTCEHVFEGCAPVPLAGYLKALGAFRLVAEQRDETARGFWRNERFVIKTRLSEEELIRFFLNEFQPTPVISPWNAGSGFYFREGKVKEKDPTTGKRIKTGVRDQATAATRALNGMLAAEAKRFRAYREAIRVAKNRLEENNYVAAPTDQEKAALIRMLRSEMPDVAVAWIDAAATVTQLDVVFPPLLGSGGNDGNLDFSTTVIQAINLLIDAASGEPLLVAEALLASALFADTTQAAGGAAISQFAPGAVDAPNSGVGFSGDAAGNAWDIILGLEGALVMSTALVRRFDAEGGGAASFPFMVSRRGVFGAGAGNVAPADESARGEFWAPLWERPAALGEVKALFREGRAVVDRATANSALDFAQALGRLGVDRGVDHFERYAFEQRYGNMYLGVPLGRRKVERNPNADLIADITAFGWLARARSAVRGKGAPASMLALGRRLDDALFRLAEDRSSAVVQEALIEIGALTLNTGRRPNLRASLPPPSLSREWVKAGEDDTHEFILATALASLDAETKDGDFRLPFRRHLAPLGWAKGRDVWADTTEAVAFAVWTGRDLVRDMSSVLERRLVEAQRHEFVHKDNPELPLRGWRTAPLASVMAFLGDQTDDSRIAALAAGLAWLTAQRRHAPPITSGDVASTQDDESRPHEMEAAAESPPEGELPEIVGRAVEMQGTTALRPLADAVPFAYAVLKPLFDPKGVAPPRPPIKGRRRYGSEDGRLRKVIDPTPVARLLRAGRVDDALLTAQRLARGAGLGVAYGHAMINGPRRSRDIEATRLAAALLMPVSDADIETLAWRAYPDLRRHTEEADAAQSEGAGERPALADRGDT